MERTQPDSGARGAAIPARLWMLAAALCAAGLTWTPPADSAPDDSHATDTALCATADEARGSADVDSLDPLQHRRIESGEVKDASALTFADYVDELVELGLHTADAAHAGDEDAAIEADRAARQRFDDMMRAIPDADALALQSLGDTSAADGDPAAFADVVRRNVLLLALSTGMQRRLGDDGQTSDLDAITSGALTLLLARADLAEPLGAGLLVNRPFLGEAHEGAVLALVTASGEGAFPQPVAVQLLSTLWDNLQRTGARSSQRLTGLALLLLDVGNASERLAAARRLLLDERTRDVVLAHLRRTRDDALARTLAMAAAEELPAAAAFSVITQAAEITGQDTAPFLTLAHRDVSLLRSEYEQRLGSDVTPRVRALLVAGAGFSDAPEGIEVARLALASDPDPEVRMRALFVLTGRCAETLGEAAVQQALDDPRIAGDPQRLAAVVLAVENLARQGLVNPVHRLGERLRATAGLPQSARTLLDRLLAETLPGGGSTGGSTGGSVANGASGQR